MGNVFYEDKFYNEKVKLEFMDNYAKGTKEILSRIFKVSCSLETDLNKDLYDFSREELRRLFFQFRAKTEYSSKATVTWVMKYLDFCLEEGYLEGTSPLDGISKEWKEQFVNKSIKKYWTEVELDEIIDNCKNANDGVIIELLRSGARGTGNVEILNLMDEDIHRDTNELTLTDEHGNKRRIPVSEKCIKLCIRASLDTDYEKMNGKPSVDIKSPIANLVNNSYIVKSANTRTIHFENAEKNIVHRRLSKIAKEIGEPQFASPLNLIYSGMLTLGKNLLIQNDELGEDEYKIIAKQFGFESDQSMIRLKQEFLNVDFIKSFYELS